MTPSEIAALVHERKQGKGPRARKRFYMDCRRWGGVVNTPLKVSPTATRAVTDRNVALRLAHALADELEARTAADQARRVQEAREAAETAKQAAMLGLSVDADLISASAAHVTDLEDAGKSQSWVSNTVRMLNRAAYYFQVVQPAEDRSAWKARGVPAEPRNLMTISAPDVKAFIRWLQSEGFVAYEHQRRELLRANGGRMPTRPPRPCGAQTVRHHLAALSGVYETAADAGSIPDDKNPVSRVKRRPPLPGPKVKMLEVDELGLLLEAGKLYDQWLNVHGGNPAGGRKPLPCAFALLVFMAYTGCREDEARRATVADLRFEDGVVVVHGAHKGRSGSLRKKDRLVPIHPHAREVLQPFARGLRSIGNAPLFTSADGKPFRDWRKALDLIGGLAGYGRGEIRSLRFRHSYITHRFTCDGVDANSVRLEVGHMNLKTASEVYAAAQTRSRRMGPVFDYRLHEEDREKHRECLVRMHERMEAAA